MKNLIETKEQLPKEAFSNDAIDWEYVSKELTLSENFIREFKNKVCWYDISKCQPLSESFIREFKDRVCWSCISKYQSLSENFIKEFKLKEKYKKEISHNWHYKSNEKKLKLIRKLNAYEIKGNKIIAYIYTMENGNSIFKPTLHVGKIYTSNANYNDLDDDGHGLSACTKEEALNYYDVGKLFEVEININNVACLTKKNKLRCTEIKIINEINK